jgi:hypothetical protein
MRVLLTLRGGLTTAQTPPISARCGDIVERVFIAATGAALCAVGHYPQLASVLYHGRHDGVGDCVSDRLQGTSADVFALCLVWAVNSYGLRAVAVLLV